MSGTLLSLLLWPGSGHLLRGHNTRALAWLGLSAALLTLAGYSELAMWLGFFGCRVGSSFDYWWGARKERELPTLKHALGALVLYMGIAIVLMQGIKHFAVRAFKIPSASMAPTLNVGDHIMVNRFDRKPERGKLVAFKYPCNSDQDFIKRIIAVENDSVEVRCGLVYVNGEKLAQEKLKQITYTDIDHRGAAIEETGFLNRESHGAHTYKLIQPIDKILGQEPSWSADFPGPNLPNCSQTADGYLQPGQSHEQILGELVSNEQAEDGYCSPHQSYIVPKGHFFTMGDNRSNSSDSRVWGAVPNDAIVGSYSYIWWSKPPKQD